MWRSLHGITRNRPSLHQPAPLSSSASADPQQRPPPRVVILGAGYAGSLLARELEEDVSAGRIELVVVDRRDHCHHKIGAIRASVRNGEWSERVRIPLNRVLRHPARVVLGEVVAVDPENKVLRFSNDHVAQLRFDILVCSTGALNHSPGDLPASVRTEEQARDYFKDTANAIRDARDIIIVGGGASAVEYAGEIRAMYKDKPITIICSAMHLLTSSVAPMSPKFLDALYERLEEKQIKLIRGEKVNKPEGFNFDSEKYIRGPVTITTRGQRNLSMTADLVLWAASWALNVSLYPEEWLNEMSELNIRSTFQLVDRPDVFAIGDVSSLVETKQAITLPSKMKLIRHNILRVAEAISSSTTTMAALDSSAVKGLKEYRITDKVTLYLPVGEKEGVSQVGKSVYGNSKTSKWKGRDLYTDHFWKLLTGSKPPHLVDG